MLGGVGQLMRPSLVSGDYLVAPGILLPPLTLTRSQSAGVQSTALGSNGATWQTYAADVPRFNSTARRLLISGARTNQNANPRGEGASGTTLPTGWTGSFGGLALTSATRVTRNGVEGVDLRFAGTPSSTAAQSMVCGSVDAVAIGTSVSNSAFFQLSSGTLTNVSQITLRCQTEAGGTAFTLGSFAQQINVITTAGTNSSTQIRWNYNDTVTPVDFTLFIGWPHREHATFASTPILPAVGSPAASTRGADLISASLASLGIGANGACTVLWSGMIPQAAGSASQTIAQIDDNSNSNSYFFRNENGGSNIVVRRITASVASGVFIAGTMTPGTPFASGVAIDGAGRIAGSFNGGAVVAATGGPTSGLLRFRLGVDASGTSNLFGETARLSILPYALSDAALQAAVAAFPTS